MDEIRKARKVLRKLQRRERRRTTNSRINPIPPSLVNYMIGLVCERSDCDDSDETTDVDTDVQFNNPPSDLTCPHCNAGMENNTRIKIVQGMVGVCTTCSGANVCDSNFKLRALSEAEINQMSPRGRAFIRETQAMVRGFQMLRVNTNEIGQA